MRYASLRQGMVHARPSHQTAWIALGLFVLAMLPGQSYGESIIESTLTYQTIGVSGQAAPGFEGFIYSTQWGEVQFNSTSQVTYSNRLNVAESGQGTNLLITYTGSPNNPIDIATKTGVREGMAAGSIPGVSFRSVGALPTADPNVYWVDAILTGTGVTTANDRARWLYDTSTRDFTLLTRESDPATGLGAGVLLGSNIQNVRRTSDGRLSFITDLTGTGITENNDRVSLIGTAAGYQTITREGDQVPGLPNGTVWGNHVPNDVNTSGSAVLGSQVTGNAVTTPGFWMGEAGNLTLQRQSGTQADGMTSGVNFRNFTAASINNAGQVAFVGGLDDPSMPGTFSRAIFIGDPSSTLTSIARSGDPISDLGVGFEIGSLNDTAIGTDGSSVAFRTGVLPPETSNTQVALMIGTTNGLTTLMLEGQQASGAPANWTYEQLSTFSRPNAMGQVAFRSFVDRDGLNGGTGLWVGDTLGNLELIALSGNSFEVAPNDVRTIQSVAFAGDNGFNKNTFNDDGQVAFFLGFTDGSSGIFFATVGTVTRDEQAITAGSSIGGDLFASGDGGGINYTFDQVDATGNLVIDFTAVTAQDAVNRLVDQGTIAPDFKLADPGGRTQLWEIGFDGTFSGDVTLVFDYDDTGLTLADELALVIHHFVSSTWVTEEGVIDTDANTITVLVDSFSPFVLGSTIPEPTSVAILGLGGLMLLSSRRWFTT